MIGDILDRKLDYYALLQLTDDSVGRSQVRRAFRKLSLKLHPDKISQNKTLTDQEKASLHQEWLDISFAYHVLSEKTLRDKYDTLRREGVPAQERYYGRYSHRYMGVKIPLSYVLGGFFTIWTIVHWLYKFNKHKKYHQYAKETKLYKRKLKQIKQEKADDVIEPTISVKGAEMPTFFDLLPLVIIIGLYKIVKYLFYTQLFYHTIMGNPRPDRDQIIRQQYDLTEEEYQKAKERHQRKLERIKSSAKYKKYLRYQKRKLKSR